MRKLNSLVSIAKVLLGPKGCSWDKEQTLATLQKYLVEETHEVVEAIDEMDFLKIKEELGDLLYSIVFIAALAEKKKQFNFSDVERAICEKLIHRHPHIFAQKSNLSPQEVEAQWVKIKKKEQKRKSFLDGLPPTLPLLLRAQKVASRLQKHKIRLPKVKKLKEKALLERLWQLVIAAENEKISLEDSFRRKLKVLEKKYRR